MILPPRCDFCGQRTCSGRAIQCAAYFDFLSYDVLSDGDRGNIMTDDWNPKELVLIKCWEDGSVIIEEFYPQIEVAIEVLGLSDTSLYHWDNGLLVFTLSNATAIYRIISTRDNRLLMERVENLAEPRHAFAYEKLAVALRELPMNETAWQALEIICRVLKAQNPRFDPGLFMEWALEGK